MPLPKRNQQQWQDVIDKIKKRHDDPTDEYNYIGFLPSKPDDRDFPLFKVAEPVPIPSSVRLDFLVPKILDQGRCGACVGFSSAGIANAFANRERNLPKDGLSPLFAYIRARQIGNVPQNLEGAYPRDSLKSLLHEGICPESSLPYSRLNQTSCLALPQITSQHMQEATPYKIKAYARIYSVDEIKQALANGKLVKFCIIVAKNFYTPVNGFVDVPEGYIAGLHDTYCCGYDDNLTWNGHKGFFRVANSWNTTYGDSGFVWIPYSFVKWQSDIGMMALDEAWCVEDLILPTGKKTVTMIIDSPTVFVDNKAFQIDHMNDKVVPKIINGRTMLPLRFLVSNILNKPIEYFPTDKKIVIGDTHNNITLWIDKNKALVNHSEITLDVAPTIIQDRAFVPTRFVAEQLGVKVDWDAINKKVTLYI